MKLSDVRTPDPTFVIIDPGKRTGALVRVPGEPWGVKDFPLDELPLWLAGVLGLVRPDFVGVEDFNLTGGNRRNDPKVPAARGIGMVEAVCALTGVPHIILPRNAKTAGHSALDADGKTAFTTARNDHRRDVIDLAGFVLREIRVAHHNANRSH